MSQKKTMLQVMGMMVALGLASCEAYEEQKIQAQPGETVIVNESTNLRLDRLAEDEFSAIGSGYAWTEADGVFITTTSTDGGTPSKEETKVGGVSRSDGYVLRDTIACGEQFVDPVFTLAGEPTETDITSADSIGAKTVKVYNGTDTQVLTTEDLYKILFVESTLPTPSYRPVSKVTGVRYAPGTDENSRIVWVEVQVDQEVNGTTAGTAFDQTYEVGYVQTKAAAPQDPYEVRIKDFQLFRTYRKKTQHSICEGYLSFGVYNSVTGELIEEISTDAFSMQLGKTGHFGSPTNGYIVGEARLIGEAPTSVTEVELTDNEEALTASHQVGNFTVTVSCTSQDYYVHFPVRGRSDEEGGMEAGGQNLFLEATLTYSRPATPTEPAWTKTWSFTHKTDVNVVGWETRTPQVDRSNEVVNDVDGARNLKYENTFVVEFVNHLYLDGEEIVQMDGDNDFYYPVSKTTGTVKPFHTSEMAIDCWTSYLP